MKTNLDGLFKCDDKMEKDGIWYAISDTTKFLIRRFGGANAIEIKKAMAKHYKPYAHLVKNNTLSHDKEREILTKVFVESCMIDWTGVEIDGQITPYSKEVAIQFFLALPELCDVLREYASDSKNYRVELGNS